MAPTLPNLPDFGANIPTTEAGPGAMAGGGAVVGGILTTRIPMRTPARRAALYQRRYQSP